LISLYLLKNTQNVINLLTQLGDIVKLRKKHEQVITIFHMQYEILNINLQIKMRIKSVNIK